MSFVYESYGITVRCMQRLRKWMLNWTLPTSTADFNRIQETHLSTISIVSLYEMAERLSVISIVILLENIQSLEYGVCMNLKKST